MECGLMYRFTDYCVCPQCWAALDEDPRGLHCTQCQNVYAVQEGIPILLPHYEDATRDRYLRNYSQIAHDDLDTPFEYDRARRHQVLIDFIGNTRGKKVLDIGSSNAIYLRELQADFKVALDLAYPFLAAVPATNGIARICGDAEYLPFAPGFFDVVVISDILEHLLEPANLVQRLHAICTPQTRIIVHIPWQENIAVYRDSPYEFTHLRSFDAYSFAQLWRGHYFISRRKKTYPDLVQPLIYRLEKKIPRVLYNIIFLLYYNNRFSKYFYTLEVWRNTWIKEIPKREKWLLYFYDPKFMMFELRPYTSSSFYTRIVDFAGALERRWLYSLPS
jgi:SAM-dependent methyltransferase